MGYPLDADFRSAGTIAPTAAPGALNSPYSLNDISGHIWGTTPNILAAPSGVNFVFNWKDATGHISLRSAIMAANSQRRPARSNFRAGPLT
jgi:hypothetical protein